MVAGFPELPFILVSIIIRARIGESSPGTCTVSRWYWSQQGVAITGHGVSG